MVEHRGNDLPDQACMVTLAHTIAFEGMEPRAVEVQCALAPGIPAFTIVGLPDKAVSEARERVRAALAALSVALPAKRITINLSPADLPKEGSHFDLPIAMALLGALGMVTQDVLDGLVCLGELSLDGSLVGVSGVLPAALEAAEQDRSLLCPGANGSEAAWVETTQVLAPSDLAAALRHFTGQQALPQPLAKAPRDDGFALDMADVKGQDKAKRALEIAAAGRHHILLTGPPGTGKSMLAARLPSILPPLSAAEALETSMIHSISGHLGEAGITAHRPFRDPHHTASMAAIVGGGKGAKPGEVSLAHNGVLFLDELPEFSRAVLETLRQPIETARVSVSRANAHVHYPCRFMLVAAANPCRCGYLSDPSRACGRAPQCGADYLGRISGPLMDRIDLMQEVPQVDYRDLGAPAAGPSSGEMRARVQAARDIQTARFSGLEGVHTNADAAGSVLDEVAQLDTAAQGILTAFATRFSLSARAYHRALRLARTIADLEGAARIDHGHLAEALSFRQTGPTAAAA